MTVFVSLGSPVSLATRREIPPETELVVGKDYELEHYIKETRVLTAKETEGTLAYFTRQWAVEHPEYELTHVAFERASQPRVRVQFRVHRASPIVISTVIIIAVALLAAALVAIVAFYAWEVVRTVAYEVIKFVKDPGGYIAQNPIGAALIVGGAAVAAYAVYRLIRSKIAKPPPKR